MSLEGALLVRGLDLARQERVATVRLTNAQIKALNATPVTLVAAQGTYRFIELVSAVLFLNAGTNVLTESTDNLAIKYTDASGVQASEDIEATGFIDASVDTFTTAVPKINTIVAKSGVLNEALVLVNSGSGEFGGNAADDATMDVRVIYRVHKFEY
jgi:hypothetical protein